MERERAAGDDHGLDVHREQGRRPGAAGPTRARSSIRLARQHRRRRRPLHRGRPGRWSSSSTFAGNSATEEGGGISIDNFGDVTISDTVVTRQHRRRRRRRHREQRLPRHVRAAARHRQPGRPRRRRHLQLVEQPVLHPRHHVERNSALSGGGLANAPDNDLIVRGSLFLRNIARQPGISEDGDTEEGGHGGGIFSLADGDSLIENTTISGNSAATGGGGLFHDADGELKLNNLTIWGNSAPRGGGIGVAESDFVAGDPAEAERRGDRAQLDRRRQPQGRQLRLVRDLRRRQPRHGRNPGGPAAGRGRRAPRGDQLLPRGRRQQRLDRLGPPRPAQPATSPWTRSPTTAARRSRTGSTTAAWRSTRPSRPARRPTSAA